MEGDHRRHPRVPPPTSTVTAQTSHLDLLRMTRAVQRAAVEDDLDMLHLELCHLRNALVEHLHGEHDAHARRSSMVERVVAQGQHNLLRLVGDLVFTTAEHGADCTCLVRIAELHGALTRQARLEARVFLTADPEGR